MESATPKLKSKSTPAWSDSPALAYLADDQPADGLAAIETRALGMGATIGAPGWLLTETVAAFGLSSMVHLLAVVGLGLASIPAAHEPAAAGLVAAMEEPAAALLNQVLEQDTSASERLSTSESSLDLAGGAQLLASPVSEPVLDRQVVELADALPTLDMGEIEVFRASDTHFAAEVPDGTLGDPQAVVGGYSDAMDRITRELLMLLSKRKTLVIWCFDQSESMLDDRREIEARVERVYEELGLANATESDVLLTAVTSYGQRWRQHTERPTSNLDEVRKAIASVPVDPSGLEMMCQAIVQSLSTFGKFATQGRRQLALILVTDESGDSASNASLIEPTIAAARALRTPIYVMGREAVFGYPYATMRWTDPKTKLPFWVRIDRGPETPFPELFQTDGYRARSDAHASGFGPYEQVRLARETGGIFFMLPSPETNLVQRDARKYPLEAMRPYLPDLSARDRYAAERDASEFRSTVSSVIEEFDPHDPRQAAELRVKLDNFAVEPAKFAAQAAAEMARAERLVAMLRQAQKALEAVRPLRAREASPRWRANFDLLYAQAVGYQARLIEYRLGLAEYSKKLPPIANVQAKGPKSQKNQKTNAWDVRNVRPTRGARQTQLTIDRARTLFEEVMAEHPGTPYAARAQWEARRAYGIQLVEDYIDPRRRSVQVPKL